MGDLEPQRVREMLHGGLRRVVRRQARRGRVRRQRRDDQHITAALEHRGQRGPHGVEHARDIDVHQRLKRLGIDLQHRSVRRDSRVGHHDIEPAEPLHRGVHHLLHGLQIADVGNPSEHPVGAESVGQFSQRRLVQVGEHQLRAARVQAAGHLGADAARAAGDEDCLSGY